MGCLQAARSKREEPNTSCKHPRFKGCCVCSKINISVCQRKPRGGIEFFLKIFMISKNSRCQNRISNLAIQHRQAAQLPAVPERGPRKVTSRLEKNCHRSSDTSAKNFWQSRQILHSPGALTSSGCSLLKHGSLQTKHSPL